MQPRTMFEWRTDRGEVVAAVAQGIAVGPRGPRATYIAMVRGEQVVKDRYACAVRVINQWLAINRIHAQPYPVQK